MLRITEKTPRLDMEREKSQKTYSKVTTYIASEELAKELTERMEKKAEQYKEESERKKRNSGSLSKRNGAFR